MTGLVGEVDLLDDELDVIPEVEIPVPVVTDATATETPAEEDDDDGVVDLDEELHPDDVEEPLDVLLQERTASAKLEDDEEDLEEEEADGDALADGPTRIVPRPIAPLRTFSLNLSVTFAFRATTHTAARLGSLGLGPPPPGPECGTLNPPPPSPTTATRTAPTQHCIATSL